MTYIVFGGTLNLTQSITHCTSTETCRREFNIRKTRQSWDAMKMTDGGGRDDASPY